MGPARNCLSADARRAHRENVIAQKETGTAEVNATIRLQNAALFCLSALGLPQASADLQEKGADKPPIGREDSTGSAVSSFAAHPAAFPSYTLMFVALIVNESNLPNVYVSLEDFTLCVQVRTKSGRLESAQSSLKLIDQVMPVAISVVVDGLLVFLYLNGREALDQPKRLSDYAAEAQNVQAGDIVCGRSAKAMEAVQRGDVTRQATRRGEWLVQVARSQAAKVLKRKPGSGATEEIPLTVFNIIEARQPVTQLVIQFTQVQLNDESLAAMGQKKAGLAEVLDPDTIMWMVLALGTAAMYLPHQHPKFLDLIKQPFVKVMQMIAGIIDGTSSKETAKCDHDLVIKNCQQISSRVAVLILRAKQESPATLALVLDAIMSRMVNEDGVIYKEDQRHPAAVLFPTGEAFYFPK
eukprot:Skav203042  [mRNA]  locus=scaffold845:25360:32932:+ [translate_table: standard]